MVKMSVAHICHGWDGVGVGVSILALELGAGLILMNNFFNGFVYARSEDASMHEQLGFGNSLVGTSTVVAVLSPFPKEEQ